MINSFGTGKPTDAGGKADGEENGSGSSGEGSPPHLNTSLASGAAGYRRQRRGLSPPWPSASGGGAPPEQEPAAFFFLCCCFCGCRLSAAAARAKSTDVMVVVLVVLVGHQRRGLSSLVVYMIMRLPNLTEAAAELNFEMLIVVNNKFVDELAFVVFVFKYLGGTV